MLKAAFDSQLATSHFYDSPPEQRYIFIEELGDALLDMDADALNSMMKANPILAKNSALMNAITKANIASMLVSQNCAPLVQSPYKPLEQRTPSPEDPTPQIRTFQEEQTEKGDEEAEDDRLFAVWRSC